MKEYLKYIWKNYTGIAIFAILLNLSCLSIGIYSTFFKLEMLFTVILLVIITWGISLAILNDSFKNNKDAGVIAVLALVINIYSAIWYYSRLKKLKPLNLKLSRDDAFSTELEMHDSEVSQIIHEKNEDHITLELRPAIVHKILKKTKTKNHTVWIQSIDIKLLKIIEAPDLPICPLNISDGYIEIDGNKFENMLELPFKKSGKCMLWLQLKNGIKLEIHSNKIEMIIKSEAEYLEDFPDD
jgi:hypothetical protein